ncbi:hypothetical protein H4Q26_004939 [Puccinia striiformis f. sp. tritici PST-130]|nr:hypothetical protein H4Q26_004939 [Puccinia striiformis f. sp. tritici PST-130]
MAAAAAVDEVLLPSSLDQVYTQASVKNQSRRWSHLVETFKDSFSLSPQFIARAPGRVNIIGEHIDYCGFSVLPSAIEPDLLIAAAVELDDEPTKSIDRSIQVQAINLNPSYPEVAFKYDPSSKIPIGNGGWSDYLKSAFNTSLDHLITGSGLSSSAAITTASVLAVLYIHSSTKLQIPKTLVASLAIAAEQACGVSVGGMDQTASVFGQPDKLLHIEFTPTIKVVPLDLPSLPSTTFIIANSLVTSKKLDSAKEQYNLRVVEYLRELVELYSPNQSIPKAIQLVLDTLPEVKLLGDPSQGLNLESILQISELIVINSMLKS